MPTEIAATGPAGEMAGSLRALHVQAGAPSVRVLADRIGTVSHTTVADVLAGRRTPSWTILSSLVRALGGDEEEFKGLWVSAKESAREPAGHEAQEFVSRYLRQVAVFTDALDLPMPHYRVRLPLDQIYVPPRVVAVPSGRADDIWTLDDQLGRAVVLGDPGIGKSALCTALMHRHALEPARAVPFLITLRNFAATIPPVRSVVGHIEHTVGTTFQVPPPEGAVARLLSRGRALVIFDGLDELDAVTGREMATIIELFCQEFPSTQVLVTARVVGYGNVQLDPEVFQTYRLLGFSSDQVSDYLRRLAQVSLPELPESDRQHFVASIESSISRLPDIQSNPMLLALTAQLYATEGRVPRSPASLVAHSARLLLNQWDRSRGITVAPRIAGAIEPTLQHLAFQMLITDQPEFTERDLLDSFTKFLAERFARPEDAASTANSILEYARGRAWMITESGRTSFGEAVYQFVHRSFMEYLAAQYLMSMPGSARELVSRLQQPDRSYLIDFAMEIAGEQWPGDVKAFAAAVVDQIDQLEPNARRSALDSLEAVLGRLAETEPASASGSLVNMLSRATAARAVREISPKPPMDDRTRTRVERFGEVAYRHKAFIQERGSMTRADSLAIRRELFGSKVQSTANLFGTIDSGALFYRDVPYGTVVSDDDPVWLTAEGERIADLWQGTHGG